MGWGNTVYLLKNYTSCSKAGVKVKGLGGCAAVLVKTMGLLFLDKSMIEHAMNMTDSLSYIVWNVNQIKLFQIWSDDSQIKTEFMAEYGHMKVCPYVTYCTSVMGFI